MNENTEPSDLLPGEGRSPWESFVSECSDFAHRLGSYMATRDGGWHDELEMRRAVMEAVRLMFDDAFFETWELAKVCKEEFNRHVDD